MHFGKRQGIRDSWDRKEERGSEREGGRESERGREEGGERDCVCS